MFLSQAYESLNIAADFGTIGFLGPGPIEGPSTVGVALAFHGDFVTVVNGGGADIGHCEEHCQPQAAHVAAGRGEKALGIVAIQEIHHGPDAFLLVDQPAGGEGSVELIGRDLPLGKKRKRRIAEELVVHDRIEVASVHIFGRFTPELAHYVGVGLG